MATCDWTDCDKRSVKRGFCNTHYERQRRTGTIITRSKDPMIRFWSRVTITPGCWVWTGAKASGYGRAFIGGKLRPAHRVTFEMYVSPIPEGLDLDHLCRNRACVNPDHLEPVTRQTNLLRGETHAARHADKTHCEAGHEFTEENTYTWAKNPTWRYCRACRREAGNRHSRDHS